MPTAIWKNTVLAEAGDAEVVIVEGNTYFPANCIRQEYFCPSDKHTVCGWKGLASYYDVVVNDEVNADAAWYYPEPKDAAKQIAGFVAFWRGVEVQA